MVIRSTIRLAIVVAALLFVQGKTLAKDVSVKTSHEFNLPAYAIWNLIAGFNTLTDYHLSVPASRLSDGGAVRHLTISEDAGSLSRF